MFYGALPQTPLKKLFEKSFLRIFKNFEKGIILDVYLTLRHGHTRTVGIFRNRFASGSRDSLKVKSASAPRLDAPAVTASVKLRRPQLRDITEALLCLIPSLCKVMLP